MACGSAAAYTSDSLVVTGTAMVCTRIRRSPDEWTVHVQTNRSERKPLETWHRQPLLAQEITISVTRGAIHEVYIRGEGKTELQPCWHETVRYNGVWYDTVQQSGVRHVTIRYDTIPRNGEAWHGTVRYDIMGYGTVLYTTVIDHPWEWKG